MKGHTETILQSIVSVFSGIRKNIKGLCILDYKVADFDTLYITEFDEVFVFSQKTTKLAPVLDLTEAQLYDIYAFLDANKHTAKSRESLLELDDVSNRRWYREPEEILNGEDTIGMVGIAYEEVLTDDLALLSVIFISPDGTYSTLTMFGSDGEEDIEVAKEDLRIIGEFLQNLSNKI